MSHATPGPLHRQVARTCRALTLAEGLPFAAHLPLRLINDTCRRHGHRFRNRLFSPAVTLWTFLSQCLDADSSCRQAVTRLLAWLCACGCRRCSTNTGTYCRARARLPEPVVADLTRTTGRCLLDTAEEQWLWKGRRVKVVDGTGVSMPDTSANQRAYPQPPRVKPGCGFPLMRLVVVFSLAVGTVLDAAMAPFQGKGTGEQSLLRTLWEEFMAGDVLLADRNFCCYWELARAVGRGVDVVSRLNASWAKDLAACRRLGPGERRMRLVKPRRPGWMSEQEYEALPEELWVRCVDVRVRQKGFRTQRLVVVTTLTDLSAATKEDLAELYRRRWQAELNLRSLKQALRMDILRGQTPELVRKEVWAHLLVYNVIRGLMAQAARGQDVRPEAVSFTGTVQAVRGFLPHLRAARDEAEALRLVEELIRAIAEHQVGDRPDRTEPRKVKRRPKNYPWLTEPRSDARARLRDES